VPNPVPSVVLIVLAAALSVAIVVGVVRGRRWGSPEVSTRQAGSDGKRLVRFGLGLVERPPALRLAASPGH
jgi:hypothetical protein